MRATHACHSLGANVLTLIVPCLAPGFRHPPSSVEIPQSETFYDSLTCGIPPAPASLTMASVVVLVVGTTFCLLAGYYALVRGRRRDLAGAKGCRSPKRLPSKDPFFRLDYFINTLRWMRKNCFLDEIHRCYASSGRTFQVEWLGTSIIHSVEPANVQTVFATRFRDWGVEPLREPAQRLCGRGFITTDGPEWERSRTLMKPSLRKANISDFSALEHYLAILIDRIPTDGSTVDLQLLVLDMVSQRR